MLNREYLVNSRRTSIPIWIPRGFFIGRVDFEEHWINLDRPASLMLPTLEAAFHESGINHMRVRGDVPLTGWDLEPKSSAKLQSD